MLYPFLHRAVSLGLYNSEAYLLTPSTPENRPKLRIPLAPVPEDVTDGPLSVPSSPVPTTNMVNRSRARVEGVSTKTERVDACTKKLEEQIRQLESLSNKFKRKVDRIAQGFQDLTGELSQYSEEFEGLENDYHHALAALHEERETVYSYMGKLRNAEVEIGVLFDCIPEGAGEALCGYSQAKTFLPKYERYA